MFDKTISEVAEDVEMAPTFYSGPQTAAGWSHSQPGHAQFSFGFSAMHTTLDISANSTLSAAVSW